MIFSNANRPYRAVDEEQIRRMQSSSGMNDHLDLPRYTPHMNDHLNIPHYVSPDARQQTLGPGDELNRWGPAPSLPLPASVATVTQGSLQPDRTVRGLSDSYISAMDNEIAAAIAALNAQRNANVSGMNAQLSSLNAAEPMQREVIRNNTRDAIKNSVAGSIASGRLGGGAQAGNSAAALGAGAQSQAMLTQELDNKRNEIATAIAAERQRVALAIAQRKREILRDYLLQQQQLLNTQMQGFGT